MLHLTSLAQIDLTVEYHIEYDERGKGSAVIDDLWHERGFTALEFFKDDVIDELAGQIDEDLAGADVSPRGLDWLDEAKEAPHDPV